MLVHSWGVNNEAMTRDLPIVEGCAATGLGGGGAGCDFLLNKPMTKMKVRTSFGVEEKKIDSQLLWAQV